MRFETIASIMIGMAVGMVVGIGGYGRIYGQAWSFVRWPATITITFTCGYGASWNEIPEGLRQAAMMLAAHWFNCREAASAGPDFGPVSHVPYSARELLAPYVVRQAEVA